jgi:VWFA-related protein
MRFTLLFLLLIVAADVHPQTAELSETVEVRIVNIEAIVTDRAGNRVEGLGADDFLIHEGRQRREISNFHEYRGESGGAEPDSADTPEFPAIQERQPRTIFVIFDHGFLSPKARTSLFGALRDLLESSVGEGDQVLLASIRPRVSLLLPLTRDREEIARSIDRAERWSSTLAPSGDGWALEAEREFLDEMGEFQGSIQAGESQTMSEPGMLAALEHRVGTKRRTFALTALFDRYGGIEGRKIALLVSPFFDPGVNRADRNNTYALIEQIARGASANGFALYPIHPEGLVLPVPEASRRGQPPPAAGVWGEMMKQREALEIMAELTGGAPFYGPGEIRSLAAAARADLDSYYSIGFRRGEGDLDQERPIRVEVKQKGLRVRSRRVIIERSQPEIVSAAVLARLFDPSPSSELAVTLSTGAARSSRLRRWIVPVEIRIRSDQLIRRSSNDGDEALFSVFVASADEKGEVSPVVHRRQRVRMAPAETGGAIVYSIDLLIRSGAHVVSVGVLDELGPQTGYARIVVRPDEESSPADDEI